MSAKTELFAQWLGGNMVIADQGKTTGARFFVGSAETYASDSAGYGTSPEKPFATVDYAIGQCTASDGDIIYVMPGHVEDYDGTTTGFDADVAGISIIGLGEGSLRPRFDFDATASKCIIGADDVTLKNLTFRAGTASVVDGLELETGVTGCVLEDLEFMVGEAAGTDFFIDTIQLTSGNNDTVIRGCKFYESHSATPSNAIHSAATCARSVVENCVINGAYAVAGIKGTGADTEWLIQNNAMKVKDGEPGIELHANTTGLIVGNKIESTGATADNMIVAADCAWFNNGAVVADGSSSVIIGGGEVDTVVSTYHATTQGVVTSVHTVTDTAVSSLHTVTDTAVGSVGTAVGSAHTVTDTAVASVGTLATSTNLDHLAGTVCSDTTDAVDMSPEVTDGTVVANILTDDGDVSDYDRRYHSLEALAKTLQLYMGYELKSVAGSAMPIAIWYVDANIGASGDGKTPATAFQTITEAIAVCSDSVDDWVLVFDYSGLGATITIDKAFVHIIGNANVCMPYPRIMPASAVPGFTLGDSADRVEIANLVIGGGDQTQPAILISTAAGAYGVYIHDCVLGRDAAAPALYGVYVPAGSGAPYLTVANNKFYGADGAGIAAAGSAIRIAGNARGCNILDNYIQDIGLTATPAIWLDGGVTNPRIVGNQIKTGGDAGTGTAITLGASVDDGWICGNYACDTKEDQTNNPFVDGGSTNGWAGNYNGITLTQPA